MAAHQFSEFDRILATLSADAAPRIAHEYVMLDEVESTAYAVADMTEVVFILDFRLDVWQLWLLKKPPRRFPAAAGGVGLDLPAPLRRQDVDVEEDYHPRFTAASLRDLKGRALPIAQAERIRRGLSSVSPWAAPAPAADGAGPGEGGADGAAGGGGGGGAPGAGGAVGAGPPVGAGGAAAAVPPPADGPGPGNAVGAGPAPGGAGAGGGLAIAGANEKWRCAEAGMHRGEVVILTRNEMGFERRGVFFSQGKPYFMELVLDSQYEDFMAEPIKNEARVLPLKIDTSGRRAMTFPEAVKTMKKVQISGWSEKLGGPRTLLWYLEQLVLKNKTCEEWHVAVKAAAGVDSDGFGMAEHKAFLRMIQEMILFDGYDASNSLVAEKMIRSVQTTEYTYMMEKRDKDVASSGASGSGSSKRAIGPDEKEILFGEARGGGEFLIDPALLSYLADELRQKGEMLKSFRKFKEERGKK